ncbi:conserved hypothetical protein [Talaromyces stipitatus ATCC 10500]|uniref:BTB domain-containing protein n=1 Tax=Talaromyces stipitatus (strain ATCC 10500 / CBS 375.48 / QM 6759 / NRRL 1006) TaxID=441959 RepID=B8MD18_TALSN|nr:uncharacterized protein TSTA_113660 [Talaromyces stipitatus ATCC 10500]EED17544.1 conserved hypothetical protein [Talaromyces stipitatus ATCC 10500]
MLNEEERKELYPLGEFRHSYPRLIRRLAEAMTAMMADRDYTDLTLECDGEKFPVHKLVLCTQSEVLKAASEERWKEGKEGVIHIEGFDSLTVRRMVEFLYTGDYGQGKPDYVHVDPHNREMYDWDEPFSEEEENYSGDSEDVDTLHSKYPRTLTESEEMKHDFINAVEPHICVHAIADYYMIDDLKDLAKNKAKVTLEKQGWSSRGFLEVANYAFETTMPPKTPEEERQYYGKEILRDVIVRVALEHLNDITLLEDFDKWELHPQFAVILLRNQAAKYKSDREEWAQEKKDREKEGWNQINSWCKLMNDLDIERRRNSRMKRCIDAIRELKTCRNCNCTFNATVHSPRHETVTLDGEEHHIEKYVVRCKECLNTKHPRRNRGWNTASGWGEQATRG